MIVVANSTIFGRNLKYLRLRRNLSLSEMAALLHLEPNVLYGLEEGLIFEIEGNSLRKVYEVFDENLEDIFYTLLEDSST